MSIDSHSTPGAAPSPRGPNTFVQTGFALLMWKIFSILPLQWASAAGGFISSYVLFYLPFTRHVRTNIAIVFPHISKREREKLARRMISNIGRTFAEYPHLGTLTDPAQPWIDLRGWNVYERVKAEGRPVIFVSGHMANWELTAGTGGRRGIPLTVVYATRQSPGLERQIQRHRSAMKCELMPRGGAARPIIRRLMHKECIGMIVDQRADDGIMVPFFGHPAPTTPAPARLAIKFGAAIIPVECRRLGGPSFQVTFHEPIMPETFSAHSDPVYAVTKRINEHLEQWIVNHPADWQCRRRRWAKGSLPA
jgi:KDO2-lipid IV(A) lauroyltransferase